MNSTYCRTVFWGTSSRASSDPAVSDSYCNPWSRIVFGTRDGIKDARAGRPPFLRDLIFHKAERPGLMRSALASVRDLIAIAILLDVISQLIIFRMVHPGAALLIGPVLIALPYASSRALANRTAKWRAGPPPRGDRTAIAKSHRRPEPSGIVAQQGSGRGVSLKKGLRILAIALFCATISASAYAQPASPAAASAPAEMPELRVATIVAPPSVMEQLMRERVG